MRAVAATIGTALALTPAAASAAEQVTAEAMWRFGAASYEIDQGEPLTFFNADFASPGPHNVTADESGPDGSPRFRSATIPHGDTVPVVGAQQLTTGSYGFLCSVHPFMTATLVVNDTGAPVPAGGPSSPTPPPAPAPAPPADTSRPRLEVALGPSSLRRALARRGGFVATVQASEPVKLTLRLVARVDGRTVAVGRASGFDGESGGSGRFTIRPGARARKALARASRARLTLTVHAQDEAGNVTDVTTRRTLRR